MKPKAIVRDVELGHRDLARFEVDLDVRHRADVRAHQFVFDESESAAARDIAGRRRT